MRLYRSRLFALSKSESFKPRYTAQGWSAFPRQLSFTGDFEDGPAFAERMHHQAAIIATDKLSNQRIRFTYAPEIMLEARSRLSAQRAAFLIAASKTVFDGDFTSGEPFTVVSDDGDLEDLNPLEYDAALRTSIGAFGYAIATELAAKISRRRNWMNALAKYWLSLRTCSIPSIEHHPRYGDRFKVEKDAFNHAIMAQAVVSAYSSIEELNLEIRASQQVPSKIEGKWNPAVLDNLQSRLSAVGIQYDQTTLWIRRTTPTRIERTYVPPDGVRPAWARFSVRDRLVPLIDAIHYASLLRSRVSSHRMHKLTHSLTIYDVINVQNLARRLILEAMGFWGRT